MKSYRKKAIGQNVIWAEPIATHLNGQILRKKYSELSKRTSSENLIKTEVNYFTRLRSNNLQEAIGPTLLMAQFFGLMPLSGILSRDPNNLHFTSFSWRMLICLAILFGSAALCTLTALRLSKIGLDFYNNITLVFNASTTMAMLIFLNVARKWPLLVRQFSILENRFGPIYDANALGMKLTKLTAVIMVTSLVEHTLFLISNGSYARACAKSENILEEYYKVNFPQVFSKTKYRPWKALIVQLINWASTFSWNYTDLFVILMSVSLTQRFEQINRKLKNATSECKQNQIPAQSWQHLREDYVLLANLVSKVDDVIGPIILLSFSNNLYFICAQLLNSITRSSRDTVQSVYFWFSFSFLLARTVAVSLYSAGVSTAGSEYPARLLRSVPTNGYNQDAKRLLEHVTSKEVHLSGMKFFSIGRGLILTVAGTIITYELVLVQFNQQNLNKITNETYCLDFTV